MREDTIRFSLLHEEGHKIRPQSGTGAIFLIMLAFIPCLLTFLFYWDYPVFVYSSLMYFIILVVLVLRNFAGSFHGNEFDADVFAAEILRDFYGIKKPSYVVYSTLTEIHAVLYPEYSGNVSISDRIISGLLAPLHPSMKERVNTVARLVDCY